MKSSTVRYVVGGLLILGILVPRIALLQNGLDSQRIWDTNTPASFRWLYSTTKGDLLNFYKQPQKYALLGSYFHIPVVGVYYLAQKALGHYGNPTDFMNAYALGETDLFFWIRLEMLVLNLGALWMLYYVTKKFTNNSKRAGLYALALGAVNFYVTIFSVSPRIHSFAFLGGVVTLYASLLLMNTKTTRTHLFAFGAAGIAASLSQSGFPALVLPILAHCYDPDKNKWIIRDRIRMFGIGILVYILLVVAIGYPASIFAALKGNVSALAQAFLSADHGGAALSFRHPFSFFRNYFLSSELVTTWLLLVGFWYLWCSRKRERIHLEPYDIMALGHIGLFFVIFGFSNFLVGRFTLAILPSLFFVLARLVARLERKKGMVYVSVLFLALQAFGVISLAGIGFGGDTRTEAVQFILSNTTPQDRIASTIDPMLLGIAPHPNSVENDEIGDPGFTDTVISEHDLIGPKTRFIRFWNPASREEKEPHFKDYKYVILSADNPGRLRAEVKLTQEGFDLKKTIFATRDHNSELPSFVPWDAITPFPRAPLPWRLQNFRAMGPTIFIYERST